MNFYAYLYFDPERKEYFYAGKGKERRAFRHLQRSDFHPLTHRIRKMKANGVEPEVQILECGSEEDAFFVERACIQLFGRRDLGTGSLLNLTDGGEGSSGVVFSDEYKRNMSKAVSGEKNGFFGKKHSEETRKKLSAKKPVGIFVGEKNGFFGKKHSEETKRKIGISSLGRRRDL